MVIKARVILLSMTLIEAVLAVLAARAEEAAKAVEAARNLDQPSLGSNRPNDLFCASFKSG